MAQRKSISLTLECLEDRTVLSGLTDPTQIVTPAALPLPPVGVAFVDPVFGTSIRRVSDTSDQGGFETHIYSQLQAFSTDNAYLLLTGTNGYVVRRVSDLSPVQGLDPSEWNAVRWHPTQPHVLVHFDTNADEDVTVQFTNVDTGVTTDVFTFPVAYTHVFNNQSFDELSDDGRWLAGMVKRNDEEPVLFSLDLENHLLGTELALHDIYTTHAQPDPVWGEVEPDWVGVSPLGRYLVVGWARDGTEGGSGVETFDIQTGAFVGRVNDGHQHGDLGVLPDNTTEYYVTFEIYGSPADRNRPALGLRLLPGNAVVSQPTYLQSIDWGNGEHISARGPNGVALITSGTDAANGWSAFEGEVWLQYTDGSVLRLAHHRSSSSDYWVQPRASISRDGRYVVFASDWGRVTGGLGDPYIIDLQNQALPPPLVNQTPHLDSVANQSVNEGSLLTLTARASDIDGNALTFSLDAGAPVGASIHPTTGVFSWTPTEYHGPGTYPVTVRVTDNGTPHLSDATTFTITVLELPTLAIADVSVPEGNSGTVAAAFTVQLSAASTNKVTAHYATVAGSATSGVDYRTRSGTLTFNPGETTKTITIPIIGDTRDELDETFFVKLSDAVHATLVTSQACGTIIDNDPPPALSINHVTITESDSGTKTAVFTLKLSAASGKVVTAEYATAPGSAAAGLDYTTASGTITFNPGETTRTIGIEILGDLRDEPNETFFVNLPGASNATRATTQGNGIILDNDPAPQLVINDVIVQENASGTAIAQFTVTLSAASEKSVTVNYTTANGSARAGTDYRAASGTLTFAPGETTRTISVIVLSDALLEPTPETWFVNLTKATHATSADSQGVGTIVDALGLADGVQGHASATHAGSGMVSTWINVAAQVWACDLMLYELSKVGGR